MAEQPAPDSVAAEGPETDPIDIAAPAPAPGGDSKVAQKVGYGDILKHARVRVLASVRAANKLAMSTVSYGAMVYLGQQGATQLQISLVSSSTYLAALLLGVQGGSVADSVSKRLALAGGQTVLGLLCFALPTFLGNGVGDLMFLMFVSSALMQVVTPGLKAAVALVATPEELATTSALVSVIGSIASGIGSAFVAPILIKVSGIDAVLYVAGTLYFIGALRGLKVPEEVGRPSMEALRAVEWKPKALSLRETARSIVNNRAVETMILCSAIVVALFEAFNTLIPLYVKDVLNTDPANSVYIFAPAGIGFLIGTFATPPLIRRWGERQLAVVALICMSISMALFGIIDVVAPILAPISPLRLVELFGIHLSDEVLAASVAAIPLNFGSTASGAAVANFINRNVPLIRQGATFGLEETQENALTIVLILLLGVVSNLVGAQAVMIVAPILALLLVLSLLRYSYRFAENRRISHREAIDMLSRDDDVAQFGAGPG